MAKECDSKTCDKSSCEGCASKKNPQSMQAAMNAMSNVKHVIGIVSGKGGVGKSFVTASLANRMAKKGYKVGILDADITGPSIPKMYGLKGPANVDDKGVYPAVAANGVKVMSINLLLPGEEEPRDTCLLEAPAEEEMEMTMEASEAPAEAMPETSPAEPAEQKTRTLPGADCFTVVPESVTRTSADFTLTNEEDTVLALRSEYWLETLTDGEWQPLTSNLMKSQSQTDESALESTVCTLHYDWQTLYGEVEPGDYRLAQPVILPDGSDYTLYAEFTVE